MEFKLSQDRDYLLHSKQLVAGDMQGAISSLRKTLEKVKVGGATIQSAFLLQTIGKIQADAGERADAIRSFEEADKTDQKSAMGKLAFAKFLSEVIGDNDYAKRKCDEIISMAERGELDTESVMVFKTNYVDEARALRQKLL